MRIYRYLKKREGKLLFMKSVSGKVSKSYSVQFLLPFFEFVQFGVCTEKFLLFRITCVSLLLLLSIVNGIVNTATVVSTYHLFCAFSSGV